MEKDLRPQDTALHLHPVDRADHVMLVEVEGELHGPVSDRWFALLRGVVGRRAEAMVIDLRGCRAIDGDCLDALLASATTMKARGGAGAALVMLPGSTLADAIRQVTGEEVSIHTSVDAALVALGERAMPAPPLFRLALEDKVAIIAVNGEFDGASKDDFQKHLEKALALKVPVIVDLEHCGFIDSTGIGQLVRSFELAAHRGYGLVASGPQVHRVLELVGIPEHLPTFESRDEALQALTA